MKTTLILVSMLFLLAGCGDGATKEDPCPHGICTGTPTTTSGGGGSTSAGPGASGATTSTGGGCMEAWSCTPWMPDGNGTYTRKCVDTNNCGTTNAKPNEGPAMLPDLDLDFYKCKVEPILDRGCAMMGCHGTSVGRDFHFFARGRKRNDQVVQQVPTCPVGPQMVNLDKEGSGTVMCVGWSKHTPEEWQQNFDNARSFMVGLTPAEADQCELLAQPVVGGKVHSGVHVFRSNDADYRTIKDWLGGKKLGTTCDPGAN